MLTDEQKRARTRPIKTIKKDKPYWINILWKFIRFPLHFFKGINK